MKHVLALSLAALAAAPRWAAPAAAQVSGQVIYGPDDRVDVYQVKDSRLKTLADSTAALFHSMSVTLRDGRANLWVYAYGPSLGLCRDERFYDQSFGAFCSGFLVAPDVIMTAGHCVKSDSACRKEIKFVFGFALKEEGVMPVNLPAEDVYSCGQLIGREDADGGPDWALIRLDRAVKGREPLKLDAAGAVANGTPLVVIGYPSGLPAKVAGGANVRDNSKDAYFVANTDTYAGNSGSPVFNAQTGLVEGILVNGEQDFVSRRGEDCLVSKVCAPDACRGEDVTRISVVAPKLPVAVHRARAAELGSAISESLSAVEDETRRGSSSGRSPK